MDTSVHQHERIYTLDVIRGFALLGIFFVNWPPLVNIESLDQARTYTGLDAYIRCFYDLFIQTKFYTIFSFLFGVGFYIFITRAATKTAYPTLVFIRRLMLLFLFGALHYVVLWNGDILHSYALSGLFLLLFYKRRPRTILIWAIALLCVFQSLIFAIYSVTEHTSSLSYTPIYHTPLDNWASQLTDRFSFFISGNIAVNLIYVPETVGLFLLGLYCSKINLFRRVQELNQKLKYWQASALLLTLPSWYKILSYFIMTDVYNSAEVFPYILASGKTLMVFYTITLMRLTAHPQWQRILQPFQYVGRMALTIYLMQTLVTVLLFGLLFQSSASLPLVLGIPFCVSLYLLQVYFCKWWLSQFSYGPMEYVWRLGTYSKLKQKHSPEM